MDLSAIVLSYNHPEITARTLDSALKFFDQVLLVHNGSEKKFIKQLQENFPQVEHLILPENKGFSGGANAGLKRAFEKHPWAFFITNDCQIGSIGNLPEKPAFIAPKIMIRNTPKIDSIGGIFCPEKAKLKHCRTSEEFQKSKLLKYIPGTAFLIHKEIFESVGGFDERLGTYWEDVDFSVRVGEKGFTLSVNEDWVIHHAMGKTCRNLSLYTIYYYNRNKKIISKKYTPIWKKPILYKNLAVQNVKTAGKLLMRERWEDVKTLIHAWSDEI